MKRNAVRLFFCGFLILFLELVLIRYLAGSVWNMGFFPNLVLMAVFIGMGLGFLFHQHISDQRSPSFFQASVFTLGSLVVLLYYKHPIVPGFSRWIGNLGGEVFFTMSPHESSMWDYLIFIIIFFSVISIFILISQRTAKFFRQFAPLRAYTLDISGSCAGILAFMAMSWFQLPAWIWFLILIPLFTIVLGGPILKRVVPVTAVLIICAYYVHQQDQHLLMDRAYDGVVEVKWSPYQKVEYITKPSQHIFVNGLGHQNMVAAGLLPNSLYALPYQYRKKNDLPAVANVLVIGAGSGNDVATALIYGAKHVDAVEIDPVIAGLGKKYHPSKAYHDPRVNLVINDARAFMTNTDRKYDLIVFALTDSLVKVSPMAQLRLENYIFTEQAVQTAYRLLKKDGNLVFYNFYRLPWIKEKIERMIYTGIGRYPLTRTRPKSDFSVMIVDSNIQVAPPEKQLALDIPVDDWPFLYLQHRGIPPVYLKVIAGLALFVVILGLVLHRSLRSEDVNVKNDGYIKGAFFFMGVAFLLLETKSVIQFSLLFGTTWLNNSLVFLAVLVFVLLANHLANLFPRPSLLKLSYVLLIAMCLLQLIYPLSNLLKIQNSAVRFVIASLLTFSPIFFANLIFSITFRDRPLAEHLFGWNLFGAFVGGILEYASMAVGYNFLSIIVAICYTIVFVLLKVGAGLRPAYV
jgi:SAM-dependent methyltransferase